MAEKQLLYTNLGGVIAFGLFLLLSIITIDADSTQNVMVLISEIIGAATLIGAIISLYYIKTVQRFIPVAIISFIAVWTVYGIGYEMEIAATTSHSWIWFVIFYIVMIASIFFLRVSYSRIHGAFKLLPVFLLFFNAMLLVYMVFLSIWWSLPFASV